MYDGGGEVKIPTESFLRNPLNINARYNMFASLSRYSLILLCNILVVVTKYSKFGSETTTV